MADTPSSTSSFLKSVDAKHGRFYLPPNDIYIGRSLELYGEWCESEVDLFGQILKPGATVIEVGANIGSHTVALSRMVGESGRVFAVEMQPFIAQLLSANVIVNGACNVQVSMSGVSDVNGQLQIPKINYETNYNFGGISVGFLESNPKKTDQQTVPISTLDNLFDVGRLDLLKMDVEHLELQALNGAAGLVERFHPVIYLENDDPDETDTILDQLKRMGYKAFWHVSPLFNPDNHAGNPENVFGMTTCINMLCTPVESNVVGMAEAVCASDHPKFKG
ncbi:MAG: FkbM family methyltransferase [Rhodobacteraceae bacterium]|nr:FkbM family methyltransferase [Paracoccaceae bacterium]